MVGIIHLQIGIQLAYKILDGTQGAPFEKPACQHAEP